ncbi:DUF4232 domain-containing protein [Streptomyces sp. NPDC059629]|uniref:DUF4232 domain-containing protein n=1 Tax=Streptomyces sp. NPDC059629 TaxID=3346889 RepID=UPI0036853C4A
MAMFRRGTVSPDPDSAVGYLTARRAVAALGAVAALTLLTACNDGQGTASAPDTASGAAQPASGDNSSTAGTTTNTGGTSATAGSSGSSKGSGNTSASGSDTASTRCTASQLRGHVGDNNPGAGQEHFPLVVTNFSGRSCTLYGYPGAAFVDGSGKQLGLNPTRASGSPTKITLASGDSAWAGLSFGNPEVSGARKATPAGVVITPPDEKEPVKVDWAGGAVPVSAAATLTVFQAGTGS